jgi:hypothetical protein
MIFSENRFPLFGIVRWRWRVHLKPAGSQLQALRGTGAGSLFFEPISLSNSLIQHDLFRNPVSTFSGSCSGDCHDVARVGADALPRSETGGVDMDAFGRIIDERTFELLLVTGGALVMGLLTLIYLI